MVCWNKPVNLNTSNQIKYLTTKMNMSLLKNAYQYSNWFFQMKRIFWDSVLIFLRKKRFPNFVLIDQLLLSQKILRKSLKFRILVLKWKQWFILVLLTKIGNVNQSKVRNQNKSLSFSDKHKFYRKVAKLSRSTWLEKNRYKLKNKVMSHTKVQK